MAYTPKTYYGEWWIPSEVNDSPEVFKGVLYYTGDDNSELHLYGIQFGSLFGKSIDTVWGRSADGTDITLFRCLVTKSCSSGEHIVSSCFILEGAHVRSLDEDFFNRCVVRYPYLREWATNQRIIVDVDEENRTTAHFDIDSKEPILSAQIEDGINMVLWCQLRDNFTRFSVNAEETTNLNYETEGPYSIGAFLRLTSEFSNLFSIAMYSYQQPSEVLFKNQGDSQYCRLLFKVNESKKPALGAVMKFNAFSGKLPDMLRTWHSNYIQMSPVCSYLVRSFKDEDPFDAPDFLITVQALEGYHKRFQNKKNGKDTRKLEDEIALLLEHFKDVEAINTCDFPIKCLVDTRDMYSHLIPEEEKPDAVTDMEDLFWLTQKCKILLLCCILDFLGLDTSEINSCCNGGPISNLMHSMPVKYKAPKETA